MINMIGMNAPEPLGASQLGLPTPGGPHDEGQKAATLRGGQLWDLRILGSTFSPLAPPARSLAAF